MRFGGTCWLEQKYHFNRVHTSYLKSIIVRWLNL
jgi:hypothetical protein